MGVVEIPFVQKKTKRNHHSSSKRKNYLLVWALVSLGDGQVVPQIIETNLAVCDISNICLISLLALGRIHVGLNQSNSEAKESMHLSVMHIQQRINESDHSAYFIGHALNDHVQPF